MNETSPCAGRTAFLLLGAVCEIPPHPERSPPKASRREKDGGGFLLFEGVKQEEE
jgi:hypothetical protein